jgi:ABC-2 type transport system permease protein
MNIFIHECKAYRKSTMIWSFSLMLLIVFMMLMFPAFSTDAESFKKVLEGYPQAVRDAFGIDLGNFFSILGFYCYALTMVTLCGAIQAMNLGTSIVSKEVREKTADFLLTKPVTRHQVLTAKLLAALASLVVTNIIYIAAASLMALQVKTEEFSLSTFILLSLTLFFVQLMFLAIGMIISVVVPKVKSVLTVSLATVFAFYFLGMISSTTGDDAKRYISPFKYFDTAYVMENNSYELPFLFAGGFVFIIAIGVSYFVYAKKDIHAV